MDKMLHPVPAGEAFSAPSPGLRDKGEKMKEGGGNRKGHEGEGRGRGGGNEVGTDKGGKGMEQIRN